MDQTLPDDPPVAVRDARMRRSMLPLPLSWRLAVFAAPAWHRLRAALSTAVAAATLAILFAPAIVFAITGCWAVFTFANTLYTVWRLLEHWQLAEVFARLDILDAADRVAVASAGYFAVFFALVVLFAGLLGRRRQRLFLLPGLLFVIPSTALFGTGARLTGEASWRPPKQRAGAQARLGAAARRPLWSIRAARCGARRGRERARERGRRSGDTCRLRAVRGKHGSHRGPAC